MENGDITLRVTRMGCASSGPPKIKVREFLEFLTMTPKITKAFQ
jgi:hypothetical protein